MSVGNEDIEQFVVMMMVSMFLHNYGQCVAKYPASKNEQSALTWLSLFYHSSWYPTVDQERFWQTLLSKATADVSLLINFKKEKEKRQFLN